MRIKDLAQLGGTTVRTIRYYHQLGLLAVPDAGSSWRSYGFGHLTRLMRIRWLVESGVPLADVPHLLRPPASDDERSRVQEDLTAVLASMDAKIATLTEQRAAVAVLLDRVQTRGLLSPLPPGLVRMYAALLDRSLPDDVRAAVARERDLLELAAYRIPIPEDLEQLVDAMGSGDLDELCGYWEQLHRLDRAASHRLDQSQRDQLDEIGAGVIALAERVQPNATRALLRRAAELNRPAVRAALDLAYPSPTYQYVLRTLAGQGATSPATTHDRQEGPR